MDDKKIKVLVVPDDKGGCRAWRMEWPHVKLVEMYPDEFDVVIQNDVDWTDLDFLKQFDIIDFHKGLFPNLDGFRKALQFCKQNNIVTIMDIDDYWHLGMFHPMNAQNKALKAPEKTMDNLRLADYVTTTTHIFADEIKKFNPNVEIFPNAVNTNDPQWAPDYSKSDKVRFGFIMGSSHKRDMEQFEGVMSQLPADVLEKVQMVLCGYDLRGTMTMIGKDGQITGTRDIKPEESVWYEFEKMVTGNYRYCSPEYTQFLKMFIPNAEYPNVEKEHYRRCWTQPLTNFGNLYNNIDVLLVPLDTNQFNKMKSELKMVEAGFKHKAIVMSNFGPYTIGSKSIFQKDGVIDPTGNCVLIEPTKAHKEWAKVMTKLVRNPEYITMLQDNLHEYVKDKYNLETVTKKRAEWYKKIVKNKTEN